MRVLNVLLDPRIGGIQNRIALIAPELQEDGVEQLAVLPKGSSAGRELFESVGIKTKSMAFGLLLPTKMELSRKDKILWIPQSLFFPLYLMKEIQRSNIDIVHVHGILGLRAVLSARVCEKKVVWHLVGTHYPKLLVLLWRAVLRNLANVKVLLSENTARFYLGQGERKSSEIIIEEAVDAEYLSGEKVTELQAAETRKVLGIEPNERVVTFIGNLNRAKGIEILLEAFASLLKSTTNVRLIISGQSVSTQIGYRDFLNRRMEELGLNDKARFVGRYPDLRGLLAVTTVFAVPSYAEGTPLVILEAMSMGLPVIASKVGGVPDLVSHGSTGFLVSPGDADDLKRRMLQILENPELRESLGHEARRIAVGRFAKEICVRHHSEVYRSLIPMNRDEA